MNEESRFDILFYQMNEQSRLCRPEWTNFAQSSFGISIVKWMDKVKLRLLFYQMAWNNHFVAI